MSTLERILSTAPKKGPHEEAVKRMKGLAKDYRLEDLMHELPQENAELSALTAAARKQLEPVTKEIGRDLLTQIDGEQILEMYRLLKPDQEEGRLHIEDLAAGAGRVSTTIRAARQALGLETSTARRDIDFKENGLYSALASLANLSLKDDSFAYADLQKGLPYPPINRLAIAMGYHLPDSLADAVVRDTLERHSQGGLRTGIVATWHGNVSERSAWSFVSASQWKALRFLAGLARRDGRSSPEDSRLGGMAALVMDGVRARACIEKGVPGKVAELAKGGFSKPFPDSKGWCIVVG